MGTASSQALHKQIFLPDPFRFHVGHGFLFVWEFSTVFNKTLFGQRASSGDPEMGKRLLLAPGHLSGGKNSMTNYSNVTQ